MKEHIWKIYSSNIDRCINCKIYLIKFVGKPCCESNYYDSIRGRLYDYISCDEFLIRSVIL